MCVRPGPAIGSLFYLLVFRRFPWLVNPADEVNKELAIVPFANEYRRIVNEFQRVKEEKNLVRREMRFTLELYETQLRALRSTIGALEQRQQVEEPAGQGAESIGIDR